MAGGWQTEKSIGLVLLKEIKLGQAVNVGGARDHKECSNADSRGRSQLLRLGHRMIDQTSPQFPIWLKVSVRLETRLEEKRGKKREKRKRKKEKKLKQKEKTP